MLLNTNKNVPSALNCVVEIIISVIICLIQVIPKGTGWYGCLALIMIPIFILSYFIKRKPVTIIILISSHLGYLMLIDCNQNLLKSQAIVLLTGRAFVNCGMLTNYFDKILFLLIIQIETIVISRQWDQPYLYLVFVYMLVMVFQDYINQQILKQSQSEVKLLQQRFSQFEDILAGALPISLCVITHEKILFHTKELESLINVSDFAQSISKLDLVQQYLSQPQPRFTQDHEEFKFFNKKKIINQQVHIPSQKISLDDQVIRAAFSNRDYDSSNLTSPNKEKRNCPFKVIQEHNQFLQPQISSSKSDSLLLLDLTVLQCWWQGQSAVLVIVDDLTRLKTEIEQLKKREICKDNVLASVSHDFKTPINGVVQIIEHLESHLVRDEKVLYYLKIIKQSNYFLLFMIYDILDFAMVLKNQLRLCISKFVLQDLVGEMIELMRIQAEAKHVKVILISKIRPLDMYSDSNRLKQILLNLLSNALKYTEQGVIEVIIETCFKSDQSILDPFVFSENLVKLTVKDTGAGIPEAIQANLFDMYATFDHKKGSNMNGNGLGLSICKKLVGLLGPTDDIRLVTQVGYGSSFSFILFKTLEEEDGEQPNRYVNVLKKETQLSQSPNRKNSQYYSSSQVLIFQRQHPLQQQSINVQSNVQRTFSDMISRDMISNVQASESIAEDHSGHKNLNIQLIRSGRTKVRFSKKAYAEQLRGSFGSFLQSSPPILRNFNSDQPSQFHSQGLIQDLSSVVSQNFTLNVQPVKCSIEANFILRDKKLLIVDDESFNVMCFKTLFSPYAQIDEAFNGQQALKKVQITCIYTTNIKDFQNPTQIYDYILMDLNMPIMNGYDAAKELKSLMKTNVIPYIPLIALTGSDDLEVKAMCYAVGFDAFLSKPVKLQALLSILRELQCQFT